MVDNVNLDLLTEIDVTFICDDESDAIINDATKVTGHRSNNNISENEDCLNLSHSRHCINKQVHDYESKSINVKIKHLIL